MSASPVVYLRVKRPRSTLTSHAAPHELDDDERITLRCRDLSSAETSAVSGAGGADRRYVFKRVVANAIAPPMVTTQQSQSQRRDDAIPPGNNTTAADSAGSIEERIRELSLLENNNASSSDNSTKRSVKAIPDPQQIADRSLQRSLRHAREYRDGLRCERIGRLRGVNALCIDATAFFDASCADSDFVYDLFVIDDNDNNFDAVDTRCDELIDESLLFDDSDDEFSFDRKTLHRRVDKYQRRTLSHAGAMEHYVQVPDRTAWIDYGDSDGLVVEASSGPVLVVDDAAPEGIDNYVYFDHRGDDEYDSNAEDHNGNEYPEDEMSSSRSDGSFSGDGSDGGEWPQQTLADDEDGCW